MRARNILTCISLALSDLLIGTHARLCVFDNPPNIGFRFDDELQGELDGCTTVVADNITIGDLRDSLVVQGVQNITATLIVPNNDEWGMPVIGSIEFPDLEYLGGLYVYEVNELQNFTFPKLKQVRDMVDITGIESDSRFDFASLEHAGAVRIAARIKELDLHSLQTVDNDFTIKSCTSCSKEQDDPPMLDLSGLVSVGYIDIQGQFDSVSLSALSSIGPPMNPGNTNLSSDSGARLYFNDTRHSFDLNLTHLEAVDKQLYINGKIDTLRMDSLRTTNASISIDASRPLAINLPLESAASLSLSGRITSVHLPNLSPDTPITLDSDYSCKDHDTLTEVSCPVPPKLSKADKIGMSVGIVVGVVLILVGVVFCVKRWKAKKVERQRARTELGDLPAYRAGPDAVDSSTALRPRTPPPPYSAERHT